MIKIPTWKELGINIKEILWNNNFETFNDFKQAYSSVFCAKLGYWLSKTLNHTKENFKYIYDVIFYYGYINQRREKELLEILSKNGFYVQSSFMLLDAIVGIDLIATKNNKTFVLQVKLHQNQFQNLKHIFTYSKNKNYISIFAYKNSNNWRFLDSNMKNIDFLNEIW